MHRHATDSEVDHGSDGHGDVPMSRLSDVATLYRVSIGRGLQCLLVASLVLAMSACRKPERPEPATLNEAGELEMCGQRYRVDPRITTVRGDVEHARLTVETWALLGEPRTYPLENIIFLLRCDVDGGLWEQSGPEAEHWTHVIERPDLGLIEYRKAPRVETAGKVLLFAPADDGYRKPDGSPFVVNCRVDDGWRPWQCHVRYGVGRLHVNYIFRGEHRLAQWRQLDGSIREYFGH